MRCTQSVVYVLMRLQMGMRLLSSQSVGTFIVIIVLLLGLHLILTVHFVVMTIVVRV